MVVLNMDRWLHNVQFSCFKSSDLLFLLTATLSFAHCFYQILSRADDNTVMEAVDPEVSVTCMDLTHVKKSFQLALLCTKRHPSERPTMQDVSRVLVSFLPALPTKASLLPKPIDYAKFVIDKGQQQQPIVNQQQPSQENNSSDAQWFVRFKEVVSKNTL